MRNRAWLGTFALGALAALPAGPFAQEPTVSPAPPSEARDRPTAASQAATQAADEQAVAELIARLVDPKFPVREEATRKLMDLGLAALPMLKAKMAEKDLDPEVAMRVTTVLRVIDPLQGLLAGRFTEYGWAAGAANNGDPAKESYFKILDAAKSATGVTVRYDWRNGVMELRKQGQILSGTWRQDGNAGAVELTFDGAGKFVRGRWNDSSVPDQWQPAFLR